MEFPVYPAPVVESHAETPLLQALTLRAPAALRLSHRLPGQFVRVMEREGEEGAFYAIANAPGGEGIELLVKRGDALSDRLAELKAGDSVHVSEALGQGFPVEEGRGKDLLLFATGSGIAPIRAVLQDVLLRREAFQRIYLFFGVRTKRDFPYCRELDALEAGRVELHRAISRLPPGGGHARYVQEHFEALLPSVQNAIALLCGREGMVRGVREALVKAGMPPDRIHENL